MEVEPERAERPIEEDAPKRPGQRRRRRQAEIAELSKKTLPPAEPSFRRQRHVGLIASFVAAVLLPTLIAGAYLFTRAADQFSSRVGFVVRSEEGGTAADIIGGITQLSTGVSEDSDILYEYIQSQELVQKVNARLDLRALYAKPHETDPVFAFGSDGSLEDLVDYWRRMVKVFYDPGTRLIELRVLAFDADDAQRIAEAIFEESSVLINDLSSAARRDSTRYAATDLEEAEERLRESSAALAKFRNANRIVDPSADVQSQMGVLSMFQQQLAEARIELELLRDTARDGDPRITQAERKIAAIREQIEEERRNFSISSAGEGEDLVEVIGDYERLTLDRTFAEESYVAARAAYDSARADAERNSRYLAAYLGPTRAETAQFPNRAMLMGLVALFLFLAWSIGALVFYSLRDRR